MLVTLNICIMNLFTDNDRLVHLWKDKDALANDFKLFNQSIDYLYTTSDEREKVITFVNDVIDKSPDDVEKIKRAVYTVLVDIWPSNMRDNDGDNLFKQVLVESNPDAEDSNSNSGVDVDVNITDESKHTKEVHNKYGELLMAIRTRQELIDKMQSSIADDIFNSSNAVASIINCKCANMNMDGVSSCGCSECMCQLCKLSICPCSLRRALPRRNMNK